MQLIPEPRWEAWVRGHSSLLEMAPFESLQGTVSYSSCISNYMAASCISKTRYWSKIAIFHTPCNRGPVRGGEVPVGILTYCLVRKTRMVWPPGGEKSLPIYVTVLTEYRHVTDGQTSCDGIVCGMHTRRAVKIENLFTRLDTINECNRRKDRRTDTTW